MKSIKTKNYRKPIRLSDYDYSLAGAYFITISTHDDEHLFCEIRDGQSDLSCAGKIVWEIWNSLPDRYPQISLDAAVVMPDHFHGIIIIHNVSEGKVENLNEFEDLSIEERRLKRRKMLVPKVIGYFKMNTAKRINMLMGTPGSKIWQRNYYDRIIRSVDELFKFRKYIGENPIKWEMKRRGL